MPSEIVRPGVRLAIRDGIPLYLDQRTAYVYKVRCLLDVFVDSPNKRSPRPDPSRFAFRDKSPRTRIHTRNMRKLNLVYRVVGTEVRGVEEVTNRKTSRYSNPKRPVPADGIVPTLCNHIACTIRMLDQMVGTW